MEIWLENEIEIVRRTTLTKLTTMKGDISDSI